MIQLVAPSNGIGIQLPKPLFANGLPENLTKIVVKCRAEGTTFMGALLAALFLSYILVTDTLENKAFKLQWVMGANMRQRVRVPYAKDEHAVNAFGNTLAMTVSCILANQHIHRDADLSPIESMPLTGSAGNGLGISSLGRYEYPHTHSFHSGKLRIDSLHYVGRLPFLTALCQTYVTSLDRVGYAMTHQYDETTGTSLFENTVKIMEACWKIESNVRLVDVATKLIV